MATLAVVDDQSVAPQDDLLAAIEHLLNLGTSVDEIPAKLSHWFGDEWLNREILSRRDDFVFEIARSRERARTRNLERVLRPGDPRIQLELRIARIRVPNEDGSWSSIPYADATPADLRRRATFERRLAGALLAHAEWCEECAGLIESQGVKKLGQVKGDLPALPEWREGIAS